MFLKPSSPNMRMGTVRPSPSGIARGNTSRTPPPGSGLQSAEPDPQDEFMRQTDAAELEKAGKIILASDQPDGGLALTGDKALLFHPNDDAFLMYARRGRSLVALDFQSWFVLASHPCGPGTASVRYDRFRSDEHDRIPGDPNHERGQAVALAYDAPLADSVSLMAEALLVRSDRAGRRLIGEQAMQHERSLTVSLRFKW